MRLAKHGAECVAFVETAVCPSGLRRVGTRALIGAAFRADKPTGDYFMLIRR